MLANQNIKLPEEERPNLCHVVIQNYLGKTDTSASNNGKPSTYRKISETLVASEDIEMREQPV